MQYTSLFTKSIENNDEMDGYPLKMCKFAKRMN